MMHDSLSREAFTQRLDSNFSVIASAGSGKTRALVDRVFHLAMRARQQGQDLSALAVLTYTQKAAQEMYARACKALADAHHSPAILNKAFFGTIHSFCLSLLQAYGIAIGIPPDIEVLPPHETLWEGFIQSLSSWESFLGAPQLERLSSFLKLSDYLDLAQAYPPEAFPSLSVGQPWDALTSPPSCSSPSSSASFPGLNLSESWIGLNTSPLKPLAEPDLSALLQFKGDKRNQAQIQAGQALVQSWKAARDQGHFPSGLPSFTKGGKAFQAMFNDCFQPLKTNLSHHLCSFLRNLARGYRRFRLAKRKLTYDDLVYYAKQLLKEPNRAALLKAKSYILLLDEAQDTDAEQFQLLLGLVGLWDMKQNTLSPERARGGAFCMVGDPQQSIYSQRASLSFYHNLHERLVEAGALEALQFTSTFRCAKAIVEHVNTLFPSILTSKAVGQLDFVPLHAAEKKEAGGIRLWTMPLGQLEQDIGPLGQDKEDQQNPKEDKQGPKEDKQGPKEDKQGPKEEQGPYDSYDQKDRYDKYDHYHKHDPYDTQDKKDKQDKEHREAQDEKESFQSEALFIAEKLLRSPPKLSHWGDLAILCPRKQWLLELGEALEAYSLPFQLHSGQNTLGEDPSYAWLTALYTVLERPTDAFELSGLLRELYGLEDAAMARYIRTFYHKDSLHPLNLIAPPQDTSAVFQSLASLKHLREAIQGCSLAEAFQRIVKHICLEERLACLPQKVRERGLGLEQLYLKAKKADLQQCSLGDFARILRQGLQQTGPEEAPLHNHIQLYTCHKAKGLEFEVVLLPFLSRKISRAPIAYPALHKVGDQTQLLLDASQMTPELKDLEQRYYEAELARLLYVSFTRAKEEIILIGTASFARPPSPSFAELLDRRLLEDLCKKD